MSIKSGDYREISIASVILGVVTGSLISMAFVYMSLRLGFLTVGPEVAAIIGFLFLRWFMRNGSILENNTNQTIASAIVASSYGVVFTVPVLLLLGHADFSPFLIVAASVAGSALGITLIIPLRKQMLEFDRLNFPSAVTVATILKTPGTGKRRSLFLILGFFVSVTLVVLCKMRLVSSELAIGSWFGLPSYTDTTIALSMMNIGAGLLSGVAGLPLMLGGILAYWIIAPVAVNMKWVVPVAGTFETSNLSTHILGPLGIGMIVGGALMGVILVFPYIKNAFKSLFTSAKMKIIGKHADEMPPKPWRILLATSFVLLFVVVSVSGFGKISFFTSITVSVVALIWLTLSCIIVTQCVGTTGISPLSGLSFIAIALIYKITGGDIVTSVVVAVTVCVAISQSSRMMQDMKSGFLVGAIPFKQQILQYSTSIIGPFVSLVVIYLLWRSDNVFPGFGPDSTACLDKTFDCIPAPQAVAIKSMIENIWSGSVDMSKYIAGSVLGAVISFIPIGSAGVLVGLALYLPFHITLGYSLGCLFTILAVKIRGKHFFNDVIIPISVGLILGEALTEIVYACFKVITD